MGSEHPLVQQAVYANGLCGALRAGGLLDLRYFFALSFKVSTTYVFSSPGDGADWAFATWAPP